jgi:broad specificity phosphatase PhoE
MWFPSSIRVEPTHLTAALRAPTRPGAGRRSAGGLHNLAGVEVLLVRHAHAGSKDGWSGDDRLRPLSRRGRVDARALAKVLSPYRPARVVSSPLLRCVQTVGPVAAHLQLDVEESDTLGPEGGEDAARLVLELASGGSRVVVCTHGETIDAMQAALATTSRGAGSRARFRPGAPHEKGSVWVLRFTDGRLTGARYLAPGTSVPTVVSSPGGPEVPAQGRGRR